jgi:hypothetical protein
VSPRRPAARGRLLAGLLTVAPLGTVMYVAAVAGARVRAHPEVAFGLAAFPLAALVVAVGRRAWGAVAGAGLELAALFLLHAYLTLVHAARLEGG